MKQFLSDIADALVMLGSLETDLSISDFKPNEKKIFYTIISSQEDAGQPCTISDIVNNSGMSRSTVYKTLKKLVSTNIIELQQSDHDKREFLVKLN
jgi:DNA-binding MarR family transcriptional regulator